MHVLANFTDDLAWKQMAPLKSQMEIGIHWSRNLLDSTHQQSWFLLGERNTKFFQTIATIRKRKYTIRRIKDAQGNWFDDQQGITQVITREFERRFKTDTLCNLNYALPFPTDVLETDNDFLTNNVTDQEILDAIKQINPLKAPVPDDMLAILYQKNWDIDEKSVCKMVRSFFQLEHMLKEMNRTFITLILRLRTQIVSNIIEPLPYAIYHTKLFPKVGK